MRAFLLLAVMAAGCARFPSIQDSTAELLAIAGIASRRAIVPATPCDAGLVNATGEAGDLSSWNISASGGDGWAVVSYDAASPGFGTSYAMDSKWQEIDLVAKGFSTTYLDTAPTVYFGEKFLKRADVSGIRYYLRVEIRNAAHAPIQTFNPGTQIVNPGGGPIIVYPVTSSFSGYGAGMRYIYVEDGGYDSMGWAGQFGAYLHSAFVRLSAACGLPY